MTNNKIIRAGKGVKGFNAHTVCYRPFVPEVRLSLILPGSIKTFHSFLTYNVAAVSFLFYEFTIREVEEYMHTRRVEVDL